jgi:hypothetical protein
MTSLLLILSIAAAITAYATFLITVNWRALRAATAARRAPRPVA